MRKERTKKVSNWKDLIDFVNSVNQHRDAIILCGWNLEIIGKDQTKIKNLYFSTKPVDVLLDKKSIDERYMEKKEATDIIDMTYYKIPNEQRGYCELFYYKIKYLLGLNGFKK